MKKVVYFSLLMFLSVLSAGLFTNQLEANELENEYNRFSTAFTAGYVFKHDGRFKEVYGRGIANAITADFCYYPWEVWGVGTKLSYWRAKGRTAFLKQRSIIQEVPLVFYLRRVKTFDCGLQLYGTLGGGFVWVKEKSYLGKVHTFKGLGEIEVGLNSPVWHHLNLTLALRYLFPSQCYVGNKANVGGFDLRAGIGISF